MRHFPSMLRHIPAANFLRHFPSTMRHKPAVGFTTISADCDIFRRRCDIFRKLWRFPAMRHFPALQCLKHDMSTRGRTLIYEAFNYSFYLSFMCPRNVWLTIFCFKTIWVTVWTILVSVIIFLDFARNINYVKLYYQRYDQAYIINSIETIDQHWKTNTNSFKILNLTWSVVIYIYIKQKWPINEDCA